MIDSTNFWDINYYNNPPLTDNIVIEAEEVLNVKLPILFINLLKIQNGGYTKGFAFPMKQKTTWSENHVPLNELFGIVFDKSIESGHNILDSNYLTQEWGLPEKQIVINGDGHWWITLDYRVGDNPIVKWIDVECEEELLIANNFDDFINGLVSDEEFAE
jgi:hypothetical protein